ncbi:MAG: uncharacterized protein PWP31_1586 [Clostridia bacterium]|nr:uncharacterized protein [Clostridia bacterium]
MARLTEEIKGLIDKQKVITVATASKDGLPNVVPMSFVKVYDDDNLLIVDNFMNKTRDNLENNPNMAICVWDTEKKKSYQIKGNVSIHTSGTVFDAAVSWVKEVNPKLQPKSAVLLRVDKIYVCQPGSDLGKEL